MMDRHELDLSAPNSCKLDTLLWTVSGWSFQFKDFGFSISALDFEGTVRVWNGTQRANP